jgi:hypothetical protein
MNDIVTRKKLPQEVADLIIFYAHPKLKKKQKDEILLNVRLLKLFNLYPETYNKKIRKKALKVLRTISFKYKKQFVEAFENLSLYIYI